MPPRTPIVFMPLIIETVQVHTDSLNEPVDFLTNAPTSSGSLDVQWCHGIRPGSGDTEPAIQVHRYDEHMPGTRDG
jgi:hypothetical protein